MFCFFCCCFAFHISKNYSLSWSFGLKKCLFSPPKVDGIQLEFNSIGCSSRRTVEIKWTQSKSEGRKISFISQTVTFSKLQWEEFELRCLWWSFLVKFRSDARKPKSFSPPLCFLFQFSLWHSSNIFAGKKYVICTHLLKPLRSIILFILVTLFCYFF